MNDWRLDTYKYKLITDAYFCDRFSFYFVSNMPLRKYIDAGYNTFYEVDGYLNKIFEREMKILDMALVLSIDWEYKGKNKMTWLYITDFAHLRYGTEQKIEHIGKVCINFNKGIKDIADECQHKAKLFVDNKLKRQEKENVGKVLTGNLI